MIKGDVWTSHRRLPSLFKAELDQTTRCHLAARRPPDAIRAICATESKFTGSLMMAMAFQQERFDVTSSYTLDPATGVLLSFEETSDIKGTFNLPKTERDPPLKKGIRFVMTFRLTRR